jgi:hypothetical protein
MPFKRYSKEELRQHKGEYQRKRRLLYAESVLGQAAKAQRTYKKLHPRRRQWDKLKYWAQQRGIDVTITFEFFCGLREADRCHYCDRRLPMHGGGIDRKNSALGYVEGNCVPCCTLHNHMKHVLDYDNFIDECRAIAKRFER